MTKEHEDAVRDVELIVDYILEINENKLTTNEAFQIAIKIQENVIQAKYNDLYSKANVVDTGLDCIPSALEKIAMELASLSEATSSIQYK
jgi:hypothetical protein